MSVNAKVRELTAGLEDDASMTESPPWSFRPMGLLLRIGAWLIAALLALVMFYGFLGAVIPLLMLALAPKPSLTWKEWLVTGMVEWLVTGMVCSACGGVTYAALLGFRRVRRRAVYTRQVAKCGDFSCDAMHRSFFRSFQSEGNPIWSTSSLSLAGTLGPHLGPVMIAVLLFNVLALAAVGQRSFVVGGLGAVAIVGIYNRLGRRKEKIEIASGQLKSVQCDGPLLRLRLDPPPRPALKTIDLVVAPSKAVMFLTHFNQVFPGLLPSSYSDYLKNISETVRGSTVKERLQP